MKKENQVIFPDVEEKLTVPYEVVKYLAVPNKEENSEVKYLIVPNEKEKWLTVPNEEKKQQIVPNEEEQLAFIPK